MSSFQSNSLIRLLFHFSFLKRRIDYGLTNGEISYFTIWYRVLFPAISSFHKINLSTKSVSASFRVRLGPYVTPLLLTPLNYPWIISLVYLHNSPLLPMISVIFFSIASCFLYNLKENSFSTLLDLIYYRFWLLNITLSSTLPLPYLILQASKFNSIIFI